MDAENGRQPTDEELHELGIDPDENRDKRENPRPLPDVLKDDAELDELEDEPKNDTVGR